MSKAPIHVMRFYPADYLMDGFVRGCYRRRDYLTIAFYSGFLFRSHLEGGSLPDDERTLADHLGMQERDVREALETCERAGKLVRKDGRVFHKRVVEAVAAEMVFRSKQAEHAKKRWNGDGSEATHSDTVRLAYTGRQSQPLPVPTPLPEPSPLPPPAPLPGPGSGPPRSPFLDTTSKRQSAEREALRICQELAEKTGKDGWEIISAAADYKGAQGHKLNPASMSDDRLLNTLTDLRAQLVALKNLEASQAE